MKSNLIIAVLGILALAGCSTTTSKIESAEAAVTAATTKLEAAETAVNTAAPTVTGTANVQKLQNDEAYFNTLAGDLQLLEPVLNGFLTPAPVTTGS